MAEELEEEDKEEMRDERQIELNYFTDLIDALENEDWGRLKELLENKPLSYEGSGFRRATKRWKEKY